MKKVIKLTACIDGEIVYFNPYRFTTIAETKLGRRVCFGEEMMMVEEPMEEIKKLIDEPKFIEFCKTAGKERSLLINVNQILMWYEQDDEVFLKTLDDGFVVQGTLEEVTAKIEKALEGCAS